MKLGLGSAQFGENYGITNTVGVLKENDISKILKYASDKNIGFIDTAPSYSLSEYIIGKFIKKTDRFNIITKTPKFNSKRVLKSDQKKLRDCFFSSLNKLKQKSLYALLIHRPEDLEKINGEKLFDEMIKLKKQKYVKKIGVSFSTRECLDDIIKKFPIDLIQIPVNILNHDFLENDILKKLKRKKIEIHARSILLQGALLENGKVDNSVLIKLRPFVKKLISGLKKKKISVLRASILFVDQFKEIDVGIFGVLSKKELKEIIFAHSRKFKNLSFLNNFSVNDKIKNSVNWKKIS